MIGRHVRHRIGETRNARVILDGIGACYY